MEGCFNELETYVMIIWSAVETGSAGFGHATSDCRNTQYVKCLLKRCGGTLRGRKDITCSVTHLIIGKGKV